MASGARQSVACETLGISRRTYQRWTRYGEVKVDGRPIAKRKPPANKLSEEERELVLTIANSEEFASMPPSQIVPALADRGDYVASESTFYRLLRSAGQQHHRGRAQAPRKRPITTHIATGPNQVWCWDITWIPGPAKGIYFYLYMIMDLFSRKIVGFEIYEVEASDYAARLVKKAVLTEGMVTHPLVLHSDNGSPMKGYSLLAMLDNLGVTASYSRPRVSNDNAFIESLFKTCKYRPDYPSNGFKTITTAREWVLKFTRWYNYEHKHSKLKFVTPHQRHTGQCSDIVTHRAEVYQQAKDRNPQRWSRNIRDWQLPTEVTLNPEKEGKENLLKVA